MKLYQDKELFSQLITKIANEKGINEAIIEKDYYVSLILKEIYNKNKNIVFKGGTSLSKCYNLINRFSEDIDISCEEKLSQSEIKQINHSIIDIVNNLGFNLKNKDKILSGMDYNKFEIEYPAIYKYMGLKQNIIIETVFSITAYPYENKHTSNLIYEYLKENNLLNNINYEDILPFEIKTQSIERTFIDKVFALCDYYLNNDIREHSRHLYDIYKMYNYIIFDNNLKTSIKDIRELRKTKRFCTSAKDEYNINTILTDLIQKDIYKQDYLNVTTLIIYDNVKYEDTIQVLQKIIEYNIF